jgi:Zn-dependent membrane protease YugP
MAETLFIIGSVAILPALLFAAIAQWKVHSTFNEFARMDPKLGLTAGEVARRLLDQNGCQDIDVVSVGGNLTDHYDPRRRLVALSDEIFDSTSLAAIGVAAHEAGHAIQHHKHYAPFVARQLIIHSTSFLNKMLFPLILIGIVGSFLSFLPGEFWFYFIVAMCGLYAVSFLINLVTLPTEYDASRRAKQFLRSNNYVADQSEFYAVSRVLSAAALTYLASLIISLVYLMRFTGLLLSLFSRRR